jgi:hypothetical protein
LADSIGYAGLKGEPLAERRRGIPGILGLNGISLIISNLSPFVREATNEVSPAATSKFNEKSTF